MMFTTLEDADEAAARIAKALSMSVEIGEQLSRGISLDHARQLCAIGAGYSDWRDLELRIGTADAPQTPESAITISNLAVAAEKIGIWDHALLIEAQLHNDRHIASDPAHWVDQTLELSHLFHDDISRLEAAESIFDYIRLASDPDIDDVDISSRISLAIGMEIDRDHLRKLQNTLSDKEERKAFREILDQIPPRGEDDQARMALCARAGRIDNIVASMGAQELARILTVAARHIARAGGGVSANHTLVRQACLRPPRGNWRDRWQDQIEPPR